MSTSTSTSTPLSWPVSPYLLLVLTTLFWSGNFVLGRAVHAVFTPFSLSFWRWAVALAILLPFVWRALREQGLPPWRHLPILLLLSVLGVVNFNTFVYIGLQSTTATNAVIMLSITPVLIVALSFLLLRLLQAGVHCWISSSVFQTGVFRRLCEVCCSTEYPVPCKLLLAGWLLPGLRNQPCCRG